MRQVALSIGLLATSSFLWPWLYKRGWSPGSFLAFVLIGFGAVLFLCWLSPRIESTQSPRLGGRRLAVLIVYSLPVVALEIAFAAVYWGHVGGSPPHLGGLSALPVALLVAWIVADAGMRGIAEEAVFRGFLQTALMKKYEGYAGGVVIAISITTFWFLVGHLYGIPDFHLLPYLALLSMLYGYLVAKTKRFISSAVVHVLHNAAALALAYVGSSAFQPSGRSSALVSFWLLVLAIANFIAIHLLAKAWVKAERSALR